MGVKLMVVALEVWLIVVVLDKVGLIIVVVEVKVMEVVL